MFGATEQDWQPSQESQLWTDSPPVDQGIGLDQLLEQITTDWAQVEEQEQLQQQQCEHQHEKQLQQQLQHHEHRLQQLEHQIKRRQLEQRQLQRQLRQREHRLQQREHRLEKQEQQLRLHERRLKQLEQRQQQPSPESSTDIDIQPWQPLTTPVRGGSPCRIDVIDLTEEEQTIFTQGEDFTVFSL